MYVSRNLTCEITHDFDLKIEGYENLWASVNTADSKLFIGVIYRHPSSNLNLFLENFNPFLEKINNSKLMCLLAGDFNINLLSSSTSVSEYSNFLILNAFLSLVNIPTRITENPKNVIDHNSKTIIDQLTISIPEC